MKIGFVSLGCSKNLLDSEVIIGKLKQNNYEIVNNPQKAEIIVINTCGFIESAKKEAIDTIFEMLEYKKKKCKYLIVIGCLVERYYNELIKELPEVDLFVKISDYDKFMDKIEELLYKNIIINNLKQKFNFNSNIVENNNKMKKLPMFKEEEYMNRVVTTGDKYAYLKIGEGCSNNCTYCAIPYIRGKFVSRKEEEILKEAKMLAKKGIEELIIIAQDTTKYGIDIYKKPMLADLLEKICKIRGFKWIRILYMYPEGITDELINVIKNNKKIVNYFDIPIQHISNKILKFMNRKTSKEKIEELIKKIRDKIPNVILRTSLIVGFPGETKEDFYELEEFVKNTKFDKLGVFMYSKEEGTPAEKLPNQIHFNTKKSRYNKIMQIQQKISKEKLLTKIGKNVEVLVENISFDGKYYIGRTVENTPEVDGNVYIKNTFKENILSQFIKCKIIDTDNYDIICEIV